MLWFKTIRPGTEPDHCEKVALNPTTAGSHLKIPNTVPVRSPIGMNTCPKTMGWLKMTINVVIGI